MNRLRFLWLSVFLVLLPLSSVFAQKSHVVSGIVTDSDGEALVGVSVVVEGMSTGTVTDSEGAWSLSVPASDVILQFSFLGMKTESVAVKGRGKIDVVMTEDRKYLDEVVVIGYGEVKKSDLTGSVSTINGREMTDRIMTSMEDAIRGKAAGVFISQNDGIPGSEFSIRIRGAGSINASSTPLFVVDGVLSDDVNDLSVGDVASVEILKDASSTAIYGSRGANGVVMITTRRGQEGRAKVNFAANVGMQMATRLYDMMNSEEYALMRYQVQWQYKPYALAGSTKDWLGDPNYTYYRDSSGPEANYWRIPISATEAYTQNLESPVDTDWQDVMMRNAVIQNYNLSVSGGNRQSKYSIMLGYLNQQGIVVFNGFEKYSARLNYSNSLTEKITLSTTLSLSKSIYDGIATGTSSGVTTQMLRQPPNKSIDDTDMSAEDDTEIVVSTNPYYQAEHITSDKEISTMSLRGVLDWKFNRKWMLRVTGTYFMTVNNSYTWYPKSVAQGVKQKGRAIWNNTQANKFINENLLYYTNRIDRNNVLKLMGGLTYEHYLNSFLNVENQNFEKEDLGANSIGQGTVPIVPTSSRDNSPYEILSGFARAEYALKDRYIFTATARADGSSRFGAAHKWGFFPSAAFAWKIDKERFMRRARFVDALKLRASVGSSGNTAIPAFRTLSTMKTAFVPMDGNTVEYGLKVDRPENNDLKWETTTQYDLGLDLSLWDGALAFNADAYCKITDDLLLECNAPYYSGYKKAWANVGSIMNRGIELTIGSSIVRRRGFRMNAGFNIAFNRSEVLDIPGEAMYFEAPNVLSGAGNFVVVKEGQPLGQWYGYVVDGVYSSQAEIDALPDDYSCFSLKKSELRPGDHKFVNQDDNPSITTDDRVVIGNGEPLFTGGLSLTIGYRQWDLSSSFIFSYGSEIFNANLATLDAGRDMYNQTRHLTQCWSPTLYDVEGNVFFHGNQNGRYRLPGGIAENFCLSEFIEDGSYLRLADLTLSYTFDSKVLRKARLNALKLYVAGKNLWLWSGYYGFDPEVNTKQGNLGDFMPSLDYGSYPRARSFSVGVNITF